jgi:membrane peptidoglycan carboxypeptidase
MTKHDENGKAPMGRWMRLLAEKRYRDYALGAIALGALGSFAVLYGASQELLKDYREFESVIIKDRNGETLTIAPNAYGEYDEFALSIPPRVRELLVEKEDRFFDAHPGVNPLSIMRAGFEYARGGTVSGASTITQQLVKNLLGHGQDRTVKNKLFEMLYALNLELFTSKDRILLMYANTVYMGNQLRGLSEASRAYFGKSLDTLEDSELVMLLATISSPSIQNPWKKENGTAAENLAIRLGVALAPEEEESAGGSRSYSPPRDFELASMKEECAETCTTTLDKDLTERLRSILKGHIQKTWDAGGRNGAIVVIKLPEAELLSMVGTSDTRGQIAGQQINMALKPRPIGSTAKPFIYLQGFEHGLRPYTLVNDREYKFPTAGGFPFYPKNYDGIYHGWVTLHAALSNSLNVPTVKVLQYVGLHDFYDFLEHRLEFIPLQDLDSYQYGIALGGLEMDPLTLAHLLTIFPLEGRLKPLTLYLDKDGSPGTMRTPMSGIVREKIVSDPALTELVTKVLNDRIAGVSQFGLASNLNLSQSNYAVKTGTSRDYHDTWTVGYTPDFLVVAWLGNAENTPLRQVTGQSGAGAIWHDSMELLMNSPYNKKTSLSFTRTEDVAVGGSIDFGLPEDVVLEHRDLITDDILIASPQTGDTFLFEPGMAISLVASETVSWFTDGLLLGEGTKISYAPPAPGEYSITAVDSDGVLQKIRIRIITR